MGVAHERLSPEASTAPPRPARVPSVSTIQRARGERIPSNAAPVRVPRRQPPLRRALLWLHRWGLALLVLGFALSHLAGLFGERGLLAMCLATAPLVLTVIVAGVWRFRQAKSGQRVLLSTDAQLGLLALESAFALAQLSGDRESALYPAVYLVAAFFAVAPWPRSVALGLVGVAVVQNVLRYSFADVLKTEWRGLVVQTGFILVFAVLYHLLLAARLWASRSNEQHAVTQRLREAEEEARRLRLIVADRSLDRFTADDEGQQAQRMMLGAILEVERSVGSLLEGAQTVLGGHALALYWLAEDESRLSLRDGRCAAGLLEPGPLAAGDGILGRVLRHGQTVRDTGKLGGVNWYTRSVPVRSVLAVPVIERALDGTGYVRGVLVADRLEAEAFTDRDLLFITELAGQVARASEAERLVGELHRAKEAQDRLHRAAEELNARSTIDEVAEAAVKLAKQLVPELEMIALTRVETTPTGRAHVVCRATGQGADKFDGLIYDDNDGVVAHVARLGSPLPARQPGLMDRLKIFDAKLGGYGSLRVLPLTAGTGVLGTLVTASSVRGVFDTEARRRVEDFATLVAGALSRALALEEVSKLALVDGLTGLANRRQLDLLSARAFAHASRQVRPLSILVTDMDHFKKVNDTHGHAAGDEVLKAVGAILKHEARDADVVGRYGGEEFVVVLSDTSTEGALLLAERIRKRLESTEIPTSAGVLKVTMSLGVAAFPRHGNDLESLVKAADGALYVAKHEGRNRVVVASSTAKKVPAASV